jgi:acyl-CoA reductase-like NAD-dependent aldehyde dehydrogenase
VSFTGSVPTAKSIAQAAGANLVPCSLELGGKSPFIVLADADLDNAAATGALMYRNAGQVCLAGTRFLVHEAVRKEFIAAMRATSRSSTSATRAKKPPRSARSSTRARSSA